MGVPSLDEVLNFLANVSHKGIEEGNTIRELFTTLCTVPFKSGEIVLGKY